VSRAVLSLGSNLGDRTARLREALDGLRPWLVAVSPVYETAPWGGVEQDDFLNLVAVADDPDAAPRTWLERARGLEAAAERARGAGEVRWGPRTLDVDVLVVDAVTEDDPELTLPHPRLHERAFVLVPWADVEPDAHVPAQGRVADLLDALPDAERAGVRPRPDLDAELAAHPGSVDPRSAEPDPVDPGSADRDAAERWVAP
jgi:2-amino-4-hydroxy-6-hydroxymethyldihydropteridine diphosphokinase